jgi:hypothetical protein
VTTPHAQETGRAKFTPGPWRVFMSPSGHKVVGIGEGTGDGIADCGFGIWRHGRPEHLANAHLIAAAPDLYAAIEALEWSDEALDTHGVFKPACPLCVGLQQTGHFNPCALDAALRKARGETPPPPVSP